MNSCAIGSEYDVQEYSDRGADEQTIGTNGQEPYQNDEQFHLVDDLMYMMRTVLFHLVRYECQQYKYVLLGSGLQGLEGLSQHEMI